MNGDHREGNSTKGAKLIVKRTSLYSSLRSPPPAENDVGYRQTCVRFSSRTYLAKRRAHKRYSVAFTASGGGGRPNRTQETGVLRADEGVFMALQDTLSYRTRVCLEEQAATRTPGLS